MGYVYVLSLSLMMAGCVTYAPSVPEGYAGPRAQLDDSVQSYSSSKADFFVVEEINEASVNNSLHETVRRNNGQGMSMKPYLINRPLIADKSVKITIKGRTHYAAPIQTLTRTVYQVKGIVEFTPKEGKRYVVRGELGENYSAVWIDDAETNLIVGEKVEAKGSAKLGVLEK